MEELGNQQKNAVALPESVKYARLPKKAIAGHSSLRRYASSNGTEFTPDNNNIIRIPITANGVNAFLDGAHSYLQFKVSADNKTTNEKQTLDGGLWCIIQRLRIICRNSGAVLEDLNNYNLLHSILFKYQTDPSKLPHHNAVSGTAPSMEVTGTNDGATNVVTCDFSEYKASMSRSFANNTAGSDMTLCMPIISAFLSNTKGLYIPLGASGGVEIEITLASALSSMVAATDVNYKVKSCHFFAPIVHITGDDFDNSMSQMVSVMGGLSWTGSTYENFVSNIDDADGEKSINIPIQCRSLRALMSVCRTTANVADADFHGLNNTLPNATTQYNYRVGDSMYPPSRIATVVADLDANNTANAYQQALLATGQLNSIHAQTLVNNHSFNTDSWVYAVDTEAYLNETGNVSHTGLDVLNGNLQVALEVNNNPNAAQRVDSFALKEVLFYMDSNGSFSVSR